MTLPEIGSLLRRNAAAVLAVLVVAAAAGHLVRSRPPTFAENATLVFAVYGPQGQYPALGNSSAAPLIVTADTVSRAMDSPARRARIRAAGASRARMSLVNLHNKDYPDFAYPEAALAVSARRPARVRAAFAAAVRMTEGLLTARQASVPGRDRVYAHVVSASGVTRRAGSHVRVYGGLVLLTVVAVFMTASALDRRRGARAGARRARHPRRRLARARA